MRCWKFVQWFCLQKIWILSTHVKNTKKIVHSCCKFSTILTNTKNFIFIKINTKITPANNFFVVKYFISQIIHFVRCCLLWVTKNCTNLICFPFCYWHNLLLWKNIKAEYKIITSVHSLFGTRRNHLFHLL